jgi:O-methyltransferase
MNSELVKRILVDSDNLRDLRDKFFNDKLSKKDIDFILSNKPEHEHVAWGGKSLTMLPWSVLNHLEFCIRDTVSRGVEGDFIETGVWRGGGCILAKSVYNEISPDTKVYVADSFEGLPKPDGTYPEDNDDVHYKDEYLSVSLEEVKSNFEKFKLLDNNVVFVKGWFKDTMPKLKIDKISILRLDGDMYESTIQVLDSMYDKLSVGGYCIIDDYCHTACREAVKDFRFKRGIENMIHRVDLDPSVETHYWIK